MAAPEHRHPAGCASADRGDAEAAVRVRGLGLALTIGVVGCASPGDRQTDSPATGSTPMITAARFDDLDGTTVQLYTLTNSRGLVARITNYGAIVTELHVPDRAGTLA